MQDQDQITAVKFKSGTSTQLDPGSMVKLLPGEEDMLDKIDMPSGNKITPFSPEELAFNAKIALTPKDYNIVTNEPDNEKSAVQKAFIASDLEKVTEVEDIQLKKVQSDSKWKIMSQKALVKYYSNNKRHDPEYNIIDIFLHIDVFSDKTVSDVEMEDFLNLLRQIHKKQGYLGDVETADGSEFKAKIKQLEDYVKANSVISKQQFIEVMKEIGFNAQEIAEEYYEYQYQGYLSKIFCSCFKKTLRERRHKNVMTEYDEYRRGGKSIISIAPFPPTLILEPIVRMLGLYSLTNYFILIYTTYNTAMEKKNIEVPHYKIVVILQFVSLFSLYLISYATVNYGLYFNGGKGANLRFENMTPRKWFSIILSLFFFAPIKFILLEDFVAIKTVIVFFSITFDLITGKSTSPTIEEYTVKASIAIFNMDKSQIEVFQKQKSLVRLYFMDVILLTIQIVIVFSDIIPELKEVSKDDEGYFIDYTDGVPHRIHWYENPYMITVVSCFATLASILATVVSTYFEAQSLGESFHQHWMTVIQGGFGWIPFQDLLMKKDGLFQSIDYENIKCYIPGITGKSADFKKFEFEFADSSCQQLSNIFKLKQIEEDRQGHQDNEDGKKSILKINECFKKTSLGTILNLIDSIPKCDFDIFIKEDHDWKPHYENSIYIAEIPPPPKVESEKSNVSKVLALNPQKKGGLEMITDQGIPVIEICINAEGDHHQPESFQKEMAKCLDFLLQKGFNPQTQNIFTGQTMLFYTIVHEKKESTKKLLAYMEGVQLEKGRNQMSALSATVITPNYDLFRKLVEWGGNKIDLNEELVIVDRVKRTFISYLCKMHRIYEGKNEQIKKIFVYLRDIQFKVKKHEDFKRIFRSLILSWDLEPSETTFAIWDDYRSIINDEDWFDLYTARDLKQNNMRHLMGKNSTNEYSAQNIENYRKRFNLNLRDVELAWLKLGKFSNAANKIPMIEVPNEDAPYEADARFYNNKIAKKFHDMLYECGRYTAEWNSIHEQAEKECMQQGRVKMEASKITSKLETMFLTNYKSIKTQQLRESRKVESATQGCWQKLKKISLGQKSWGSQFYFWLIFLLEFTSGLDLIGDVLVFSELFQRHPAWATLSFYFMISPFYVSFIPLINFQLSAHRQLETFEQTKPQFKILQRISKTPLLIAALILMDFIYIINTTVIKFFLVIVDFFTSRCCKNKCKVNLNFLEEFEDRAFNYLFEMQKSEVAGFRRLRTISQLIFETIPQLALQLRIYVYFKNYPEEAGAVQQSTLLNSIMFAAGHGALEMLILYIEANQYDLNFFKYFIICFNGRLGWVPMLDKMKNSVEMQKMVDRDEVLDFDDIKTNFCNMEISTEFIFSDMTAETLAQNIYKMKTINDVAMRPRLKFGKCMEFITFESVMKILDFSNLKVIIEYQDVPLKEMMMNSTRFKEYMEEDNKTGQAGKFLQNVVNLDHVHVMQCIYELRQAGDIKLTLRHDKSKSKSNKEMDIGQQLLLQAEQNHSYEMVAYLLDLGLKAKDLWGRDETVFMNLRKFFQNDKRYGLEFANKYFCCTAMLQFNLHKLQAAEFFTWADNSMWGSRLAGGASFAINFGAKKVMMISNYSPDRFCKETFDEDHVFLDRKLSIYDGFNKVFDMFVKEYEISQDFRMYICQEGISFYFEADKSLTKNEGESDREFRIRAYRIYRVGTKNNKHRREMNQIFEFDYTQKE